MIFPTSNAFPHKPHTTCEPTHISELLQITKRELDAIRNANLQVKNEHETECPNELIDSRAKGSDELDPQP